MPVSSIAQIFIRLYTLKILVGALASFVARGGPTRPKITNKQFLQLRLTSHVHCALNASTRYHMPFDLQP